MKMNRVFTAAGAVGVAGVAAFLLMRRAAAKVETRMVVTGAPPSTVSPGQEFGFSGYLEDVNGNRLEGKTIELYVDGGVAASGSTDSEGNWGWTITLDKSAVMYAEFLGDNTYVISKTPSYSVTVAGTPPPPPPPPTEYGSLEGDVVDAYTGGGIVRATVTCAGKSTTSGSDGFYRLTELPIGSQTITVSASGYKSYSIPKNIHEGANYQPLIMESEVPPPPAKVETKMDIWVRNLIPGGTVAQIGVILEALNGTWQLLAGKRADVTVYDPDGRKYTGDVVTKADNWSWTYLYIPLGIQRGTWTFKVSFAGDDNYGPSEKTREVQAT